MLFIYLSRAYRMFSPILPRPPYNCHAHIWFPLTDTCDCNIWCKYPPTKRKARI